MINKQYLSVYLGLLVVTVASAGSIFIELTPWFDYAPLLFIHENFKFFFPIGWGSVTWGLTKNPIITLGVMGLTTIAGLTLI